MRLHSQAQCSQYVGFGWEQGLRKESREQEESEARNGESERLIERLGMEGK